MNQNNPAMRLQFYTLKDLDTLPQLRKLSKERRRAMQVVAHVLPFRANNYVVEQLIDWDCAPDDPLFQLTFPQPGMLSTEHFQRMANVLDRGPQVGPMRAVSEQIRRELNPHPEGQRSYNVPTLDGKPVPGVQHKYEQTCLVFPSSGQTCHAYCTFCFRWAQFVGAQDLKFATDEAMRFREYLRRHEEVTDVLFTGGDPMVMRADVLARYVEPLLSGEFQHIQTIRIGTKSLAYWPYRYLCDKDTNKLLGLLEKVVAAGKHLAIMAHFNHGRELRTPAVRQAIRRLQSLGAVIRTQSPVIRHVNDDANVWARMWNDQVRLGLIPYYMFVERDTGAHDYFKIPLYQALRIYQGAIVQGSGLARAARGPTMSALPGKVVVEGVAEVHGNQVFVLSFLQARDAAWCKQPFFAEFDPAACWLTQLKPAFGACEFFYEHFLRELLEVHDRRPLEKAKRAPPIAPAWLADSSLPSFDAPVDSY
jgi:KamA family protein